MSKTVHATMIAFDKNSGATYTNNMVATSKEEANKQFKQFEENVPFVKWYYEIEPDSILTTEQEQIIEDLL